MKYAFSLIALAITTTACTITTGSSRARQAPPPPPAPRLATGGPAPAVRTTQAVRRPVNLKKLQALKARKAFCAPEEMAPGVWVKFDCGPEVRIARAKPLRLVNLGGHNRQFIGNGEGPVGPLPTAVDLRAMDLDGPIKDQKEVGACTAFSLSSVMDSAIRKLGHQQTVSALHVWSNYGIPTMGNAGDGNVDGMITLDESWPYDPAKACKFMQDRHDDCGEIYDVTPGSAKNDTVLVSEKQRADQGGRFRLEAVEEFSYPANPDEMAAVLAGGDAIWIAFSVDTQAWRARDGVVADYSVTERAGHAVALIGYRPHGKGRQFLIHNSWGPRWGQGGYAWMSDEMIRRHTRSAYKIRVSDGSTPPPQPSADGCPAGQIRDVVRGICAPICPSGSAPAAGVCLPAIPGFPMPGRPQQPQQPSQPQEPQQPQQPSNAGCPQGQGLDPMLRQCLPLCANGYPPIGGMCFPGFAPQR